MTRNAGIHKKPSPAFRALCAEQRRISDLIERLQEQLLALAERGYADQANWGHHGDAARIRAQLEEIVGKGAGGA